jgi:hypothetical protein
MLACASHSAPHSRTIATAERGVVSTLVLAEIDGASKR